MLGPGTGMHAHPTPTHTHTHPHTHTHTHRTRGLNISGKLPNQWVTSAPHRESTGGWSGRDRLLYHVQALLNKGLRIPTDFGQTSEQGKTKETIDSDPMSRQEPSGESQGEEGGVEGGLAAAKAIPTRMPSANLAPEHPTRTLISLAFRPVTTWLTCSHMARGSGGSVVDKLCQTLL